MNYSSSAKFTRVHLHEFICRLIDSFFDLQPQSLPPNIAPSSVLLLSHLIAQVKTAANRKAESKRDPKTVWKGGSVESRGAFPVSMS